MKTVRDCMSTDVVSVKKSTPLNKIIQLFRDHNFHTLPVVEDDNRLIGVITLEEILDVFQPHSSDLARMLKTIPFIEPSREDDLLLTDISSEMGILVVADDVMTHKFVTVKPEALINEAYSSMRLHKVKILLVTEEEKLIGVISQFDIILSLFREKGVIE